MEELKPCPFCGRVPKLSTRCDVTALHLSGRQGFFASARLKCRGCDWLSLEHYANALSESTDQEEIAKFKEKVVGMCVDEVLTRWNRRAE